MRIANMAGMRLRALFRRDELDQWVPTIFTTRTWDRRSNTEAAVKARAKTRGKTMWAKAKARAKAEAEAAGTGAQRFD